MSPRDSAVSPSPVTAAPETGAGRVRGRRHGAMAEGGRPHRSPRVPEDRGSSRNANAGQGRTAPALLENANSPPNRAQGRKCKPRQGRRADVSRSGELAADAFRPLEGGRCSSLGLSVSLCQVDKESLPLCVPATFFFFFSSDPRTEPRNPKTELQASELVHHRRRRSDVDLGDKRLPTVVRDSSRARPERLCDSLQSTQNYSSQSSKALNVPP